MMKILITSEVFTPIINGVVTSITTLKKSLEARGHKVKVLTLGNVKTSSHSSDVYRVQSLSLENIYPGVRFTFSLDDKILTDILSWKPDIIHSQTEFSSFWIAHKLAKKINIPLIHTYHTIYEDYTHYFSPIKAWGKKGASIFSRMVLSHTDAVIVPTRKVFNMLDQYGIKQPFHIVQTGIKLDSYRLSFSNIEKIVLRNKYGIPKENTLLIAVGRTAKEKNLTECLEYVARLRNSSISLMIVGSGPFLPTLKKQAKEFEIADQVIFVGMISPNKFPLYYKLGDIFVSASSSEAQGLTTIEALASGTPLICRKDQSLENVLINGFNGYEYKDFAQFKKAVHTLTKNKDLYFTLSENAKAFAYKKYSDKAFAQKVEQIYQKYLYTPIHSFNF